MNAIPLLSKNLLLGNTPYSDIWTPRDAPYGMVKMTDDNWNDDEISDQNIVYIARESWTDRCCPS